jgi:hypothetical protein
MGSRYKYRTQRSVGAEKPKFKRLKPLTEEERKELADAKLVKEIEEATLENVKKTGNRSNLREIKSRLEWANKTIKRLHG